MFWLYKRKHKIIFKTLACLIALQFIGSHAVWAQPSSLSLPVPQPSQNLALSEETLLSLQIPETYGHIKKLSIGTQDKTIIHIQDSHVNYEAQTNINHILAYLTKELADKKNGHFIIGIEGAAGPSDPEWYRLFPSHKVKEMVSDYFLRQGYISGPQFFQILNEKPVTMIGVESPDLYRKNLKFFQNTYKHNEEILKTMQQLETALLTIRDALYNERLKHLSEQSQAFHNNQLVLTDYVTFLQGLTLEEDFQLISFPHIQTTLKAIEADKKIDYDIVNKERTKLIEKLQGKLPKEEISELVSQSLYYRLGKISSLQYYSFLDQTAKAQNISIASLYPNLQWYLEVLTLHSQIDGESLYEEVLDLENQLKERLFQSKSERQCDLFLHRLQLLKHLGKLEVSRQELAEYKKNPYAFLIDEFLFFIEDRSANLKLKIDIAPNADQINSFFKEMEGFYRIALKRDDALVQNTLQAMEKEKATTAILITGGFHTEGMVKKFEGKNLSTMVVSPNLTEESDNAAYLNVMLNELMPLERVLTTKGNRLSQPLMMFVENLLVGTPTKQNLLYAQLLTLSYIALAQENGSKNIKDISVLIENAKTKILTGLSPQKREEAKPILDLIQPGTFAENRNGQLEVEIQFLGEEKPFTVRLSERQDFELYAQATAINGRLANFPFMMTPGPFQALPGWTELPERSIKASTGTRANIFEERSEESKRLARQRKASEKVTDPIAKHNQRLGELDRYIGTKLATEEIHALLEKQDDNPRVWNDIHALLLENISDTQTLQEKIKELITLSIQYPLVPNQDILTFVEVLAQFGDKMKEAKEGEIFSIDEILTKFTNLKELNMRTKDEANKEIQAGFIGLKNAFQDLYGEDSKYAAFQKFFFTGKISSVEGDSLKNLSLSNEELIEKNDFFEVYETTIDKNLIGKDSLQGKITEVEKKNPTGGKFSAEARRIYVKFTKKPQTVQEQENFKKAIEVFLNNQFRQLNASSRFSETKEIERGPNDPPHVSRTNTNNMFAYFIKQAEECRTKPLEEQDKKLHELADMISSFRLTEKDAFTPSSSQFQGQLEKAWKQISSFQAISDQETFNESVKNYIDLVRKIRRTATGHNKFFNAPGEPVYQALFLADFDTKKVPVGTFFGDGDAHGIGQYNVEQTYQELLQYLNQTASADEAQKAEQFKKLFYQTGNVRDKQLGTYVVIMAHPEEAAKRLREKEEATNAYIIKDQQIRKMIDYLHYLVASGKLDQPPPITNREELAQFLETEAKKLQSTLNYRAYARGGDELAIITKDPKTMAFWGGLVDILNEGQGAKGVYLGAGIGFAQKQEGDTAESLIKRASQAQILTKTVKNIKTKDGFYFPEKYSYTYGVQLKPEAAQAVLEGIQKQLEGVANSTDIAKLEELINPNNEKMWSLAFFGLENPSKKYLALNAKEKEISVRWNNIKKDLANLEKERSIIVTEEPVILAQVKTSSKFRLLYISKLFEGNISTLFGKANLTQEEQFQLKIFDILVAAAEKVSTPDENDKEVLNIYEQMHFAKQKTVRAIEKGVILPVYAFLNFMLNSIAGLFGVTIPRNIMEDVVVPLFEDGAMILAFVYGGPIAYGVMRMAFIAAHAPAYKVKELAPEKEPTLLARLKLPAVLSALALAAAFSFNSVIPVFSIALTSHMAGNFLVSLQKLSWEKAVIGKTTPFFETFSPAFLLSLTQSPDQVIKGAEFSLDQPLFVQLGNSHIFYISKGQNTVRFLLFDAQGKPVKDENNLQRGFELPFNKQLFIGREPAPNTFVISSPQVSRQHLVIGITPTGTLLVKDSGSTNGTYIRKMEDFYSPDEIQAQKKKQALDLKEGKRKSRALVWLQDKNIREAMHAMVEKERQRKEKKQEVLVTDKMILDKLKELEAIFRAAGHVEKNPIQNEWYLFKSKDYTDYTTGRIEGEPVSEITRLLYEDWLKAEGFQTTDIIDPEETIKENLQAIFNILQEPQISLSIEQTSIQNQQEIDHYLMLLKGKDDQTLSLKASVLSYIKEIYQNPDLTRLFKQGWFRNNLKTIQLFSPPVSVGQGKPGLSAYDPDLKSVNIYTILPKTGRKTFGLTFIHEHGHAIEQALKDYPLLEEQLKEQYKTLDKHEALYGMDFFIGPKQRIDYQSRTFEEFIAETFAAYIAQKDLLKEHAQKDPQARLAWDQIISFFDQLVAPSPKTLAQMEAELQPTTEIEPVFALIEDAVNQIEQEEWRAAISTEYGPNEKAEEKQTLPFSSFDRKHIVIGDLHGTLKALVQYLITAGLVDKTGRQWIGGNAVLVQLGDVIDRGPHSYETLLYLNYLQQEAAKHGGKVVRLLGNHEEMLYRGLDSRNEADIEFLWNWTRNLNTDFGRFLIKIETVNARLFLLNGTLDEASLAEISPAQLQAFKAERDKWKKTYDLLKKDIETQKIQAAYEYQGVLFVHGGISEESAKKITNISDTNFISANALAEGLNKAFLDFALGSTATFNEYLHNTLWDRFKKDVSGQNISFIQVVGHTPTKKDVQVLNKNVFNIDVGAAKNYGNLRGYLTLEGQTVQALEITKAPVPAPILSTIRQELENLEGKSIETLIDFSQRFHNELSKDFKNPVLQQGAKKLHAEFQRRLQIGEQEGLANLLLTFSRDPDQLSASLEGQPKLIANQKTKPLSAGSYFQMTPFYVVQILALNPNETIIAITNKNTKNRTIHAINQTIILGRSLLEEEDEALRVSRKHAKLIFENGNLYLMDLNSTHGTFVPPELLPIQPPTVVSPLDALQQVIGLIAQKKIKEERVNPKIAHPLNKGDFFRIENIVFQLVDFNETTFRLRWIDANEPNTLQEKEFTKGATIGRPTKDNQPNIPIQDKSVSRKHAEIHIGPTGHVQLTDLKTLNGTYYLNSQTVPQLIAGKGVLWPVYKGLSWLNARLGNRFSEEQLQDTWVPIVEESLMLLSFVFGGALPYIATRAAFVVAHYFQHWFVLAGWPTSITDFFKTWRKLWHNLAASLVVPTFVSLIAMVGLLPSIVAVIGPFGILVWGTLAHMKLNQWISTLRQETYHQIAQRLAEFWQKEGLTKEQFERFLWDKDLFKEFTPEHPLFPKIQKMNQIIIDRFPDWLSIDPQNPIGSFIYLRESIENLDEKKLARNIEKIFNPRPMAYHPQVDFAQPKREDHVDRWMKNPLFAEKVRTYLAKQSGKPKSEITESQIKKDLTEWQNLFRKFTSIQKNPDLKTYLEGIPAFLIESMKKKYSTYVGVTVKEKGERISSPAPFEMSYALYKDWFRNEVFQDYPIKGKEFKKEFAELSELFLEQGLTLKITEKETLEKAPEVYQSHFIPYLIYTKFLFKQYLLPVLKQPYMKNYLTTFNLMHTKSLSKGQLEQEGGAYISEEKAVYMNDYVHTGGRKTYGTLLVHEVGHAVLEALEDPNGPFAKDPFYQRPKIDLLKENYKTIGENQALYGMDFLFGTKQRIEYQEVFGEFIPETFAAYMTQPDFLLEHINESIAKQENPAKKEELTIAWYQVLAFFNEVVPLSENLAQEFRINLEKEILTIWKQLLQGQRLLPQEKVAFLQLNQLYNQFGGKPSDIRPLLISLAHEQAQKSVGDIDQYTESQKQNLDFLQGRKETLNIAINAMQTYLKGPDASDYEKDLSTQLEALIGKAYIPQIDQLFTDLLSPDISTHSRAFKILLGMTDKSEIRDTLLDKSQTIGMYILRKLRTPFQEKRERNPRETNFMKAISFDFDDPTFANLKQALADKDILALNYYSELFWNEALYGLAPTLEEESYLALYKNLLTLNSQILRRHIQRFQLLGDEEILNPTQSNLLETIADIPLTMANKNMNELFFLVTVSPKAREYYMNRLLAPTKNNVSLIIEDLLKENPTATETARIQLMAKINQVINQLNEENLLVETDETIMNQIAKFKESLLTISLVTPALVEEPILIGGAPQAPTQAVTPITPILSQQEEWTKELKKPYIPVKTLQELLNELDQSQHEKLFDQFAALIREQGGFTTPQEGMRSLEHYFTAVIKAGKPIGSDLKKIIYHINLEAFPFTPQQEALKNMLAQVQEKIKNELEERAQAIERLTKMQTYQADKQTDSFTVLVLDADNLPLIPGTTTLDEEKLNTQLKQWFHKNVKIALFSTHANGSTNGRTLEEVSTALQKKGIPSTQIITFTQTEELQQGNVPQFIDALYDKIFLNLSLSNPEDSVFITTAANNKLFFKELSNFLLYLVAEQKGEKVYVDQEVQAEYKTFTGKELPDFLKLVPQMRFNGNAIDQLKEQEEATQKAA